MVKGSDLFPLTTCSHQTIDKELLSAFVERWRKETNTFHLPIGEMTIILDDVALLLNIPTTGAFYNFENMDKGEAILVLIDLLGVEYKDAFNETKKTRGGQVHLSWLWGVYGRRC